jgi:two-component system, LuxR family, response regulator FixJ
MREAHVIFVDDEPRVCSTVRKTLERVGMTVRCFHCVEDCLPCLAVERCDLLITDVRMPGRDGLDLLREARERLPWLPVLVVTGYGDVPTAVRAMKAGAANFIEKPLDRTTFLCAVESLLSRNTGQVALKKCSLTRTEMKVLYLVLDGRNNREIAAVLHRSHRTVEVHRRHVMRKLGATSIIELLRRAADMGLLQSGLPHQEKTAAC